MAREVVQIEATFSYERETKRTYRFQEEETSDPVKIGTLYVQKTAFDSKPGRLQVTIEVIE